MLLLAAITAAAPAGAQTREAIRYTLRFPAPQTNYVEVEALVPTDGRPSVDLMMAVWTPGSYLVREYERNLEAVRATSGALALPIEKTTKNRWRVTTGGARELTMTYRVYSHELTVRNNWVDADFAMLNGAQTYLTLVESGARPHDVRLELPAAWKTSVTGMPGAPDNAPNHYRAPDYDTLVDCPIVTGNPAIHRFTVDGTPHLLVDVGEGGVFDGDRAVRDLERIVEVDRQFWGSLPYETYVFFNLLVGASGGLEHKSSVMMMASRWDTGTRAKYVAWLSLASHEYFHLWNVKRLRPIELGPFDYEHETYPRSLWISEGLTDYYADVQLSRAGLYTPDEYLHEDDAGEADADGRDGVVRRVDQAVPPRRQHRELHHQLLHEGRRARLCAGCAHPRRHRRCEEPGRRDAAGIRAVLGREGIHAGRLQESSE